MSPSENDIFYPDLGDLSTPEPGHAEGLTINLYDCPNKSRYEVKEGHDEDD